jgi:hypothetical protein
MKKTIKLIGVVALSAIMAFSLVSCGGDPKSVLPSETTGELTLSGVPVSGAPNLTDKYIVVRAMSVTPSGGSVQQLVGATDILDDGTMKLAKVSANGNNIKIKLYTWSSADGYKVFTGTGELTTLELYFVDAEELTLPDPPVFPISLTTVPNPRAGNAILKATFSDPPRPTFTGGNVTVTWTTHLDWNATAP